MIKLSPSYVFEKSRYHGNFVNFVNFSIYTRDYEWSLFPWTVTYNSSNAYEVGQGQAAHTVVRSHVKVVTRMP